jgi:hypothetical protein
MIGFFITKNLEVTMERRSFDLNELEVRTEGEKPKIRGHAAVFKELSEDLGGFRERIKPGAFAKAISKDDVRALFNHDPNYVLGRAKAGTLVLAEDDKGLAIEIDPPDTQWARDLMTSIGRKDISQMSFGFRVVKDEWIDKDLWDPKKTIRTLIEVNLFDVSPVTFPAYPQTDVKVRSVLNDAGIDFDQLTGAIERSKNNQQTQEDIALIGVSIEKLRGLVGGGAGVDLYVQGLDKLKFKFH